MGRLLLVEDDAEIGALLGSALRADGHEVAWGRTGADAIARARSSGFDLVLLDLGLPDVDGLEVCRSLRDALPDAVVVMVTARRDELDVVIGLDSGADDYVTKPFSLAELQARIRAHLRRGTVGSGAESASVRLDGLRLEPRARRCFVADAEVALRPKEFDLLLRLAIDAGQALSRTTLMADVWDENWYGSTKTLDVHIAAVRQRLTAAAASTDPPAPVPTITTLRGHGYRLDPVASAAAGTRIT